MQAVRNNDLQEVKRLCNVLDVNFQDELGRTPLMLAVMIHYRVSIVKELCDQGANIQMQNRSGTTALEYSIVVTNWGALREFCTRGVRTSNLGSNLVPIHYLLETQRFRHNLMVLLDEGVLQTDLLRYVHQWQ